MRYLTSEEVIELHRRIVDESGGALGMRESGAIDSAVAQPRMTFAGQDLYPTPMAT
jgi:death on curing protein